MRIQAHIPKNEYGFLKRDEDGTWLVETSLASTPVIEPPKGLSALGRDCYRLIGLETGEARVIRFSDLHRHSDNSLRDAILKIKDMVAGTEYSGALTDHGNIYGFLEYYKAMKKAGKKPIVGTEAYMEDMNGNLAGNHVVLLAKNAQGYQNLRKLSSESFAPENFHSNPHVTWAMLEQYHEGIICLSACLKGIIPECLKNGDIETAKAAIKQFKGLFDEDFYIEIQNHGISEEDRVRPQLVALAKEYGVKIVATTDTHYLTAEDREAHQVVLCLRTESTMDAPKMSYDGSGYFLHNSEDMEERFADYPEALDNTLEIEEKCNFEIELNQVNLPNYEIPAGFSSPFDYMCHIADKGFKTRFEGTDHFTDPAYLDRLQYEKDMIKQMGFASYFVIIWDVINYCRQHNSYIGPGRGSAAGSMVAYCMGLTDLDPIRYGLLFERFLNPERVSWPDIDTDVEYSFRPHAIEYMRKKYGQDNVCRIATFGTMAARQSIKDVTRVLGLPASLGNELSQMVPAVTKITLDKATELGTPLAARMAQDPVVERIVKLAKRIEGCRRQISVHACGVCVSPSMVSDYIPTCLAIDKETGQKVLCTQVTKDEVEELSLIKMDLLGLRNLGVMHETLDRVQTNYGKDTILKALNSMKDKVDYHDIPLNDRATYELLSKGRPVGAFQLDQPEMSRLIKNILWDLDSIPDDKLESIAFERIVAAVALYRPGPMDYIPEYLAGLKTPSLVHYDCPQEEEILSSTYGVLVYQEQLIHICQQLAGYTLGEADVIRKACAKKKAELLAAEKIKFIDGNEADVKAGKTKHHIPGCVKNGISRKTAEAIWAKMEKFGEYAFNRSHSVCYSYLTYLTAYMSCHWPNEFYAAMLNAFIEDSDKSKAYLRQAHRRNVPLLLPDVQKSQCAFMGDKDGILFGLQGIKGVKKTAENIVTERKRGGPFKDLQDLYERVCGNGDTINKKAIEGLTYSGALNCFSANKAALLRQYELIAENYKAVAPLLAMGQTSMLGMDTAHVDMPNVPNLPPNVALAKEVEVLGLYVSNHPADRYAPRLKNRPDYTSLEDVVDMNSEVGQVKTMGMIAEWRPFTTRNNETMAAFSLETKFAALPCLVFSKQFQELSPYMADGRVLCIEGGLTRDKKEEDKFVLIARKVYRPEEVLTSAEETIVAVVHNAAEQREILDFIQAHPGDTPVTLRAYNRFFPLQSKVDNGPLAKAFFSRFSEKSQTRSYK